MTSPVLLVDGGKIMALTSMTHRHLNFSNDLLNRIETQLCPGQESKQGTSYNIVQFSIFWEVQHKLGFAHDSLGPAILHREKEHTL